MIAAESDLYAGASWSFPGTGRCGGLARESVNRSGSTEFSISDEPWGLEGCCVPGKAFTLPISLGGFACKK